MRVLSALAWPGEIREEFLAGGADKLPEPTYSPIDPTPVIDGVDAARRLLRPGNVVDDWLDREATSIESTALMLSSLGTPAFHAYSRKLYGVPSQPLALRPRHAARPRPEGARLDRRPAAGRAAPAGAAHEDER